MKIKKLLVGCIVMSLTASDLSPMVMAYPGAEAMEEIGIEEEVFESAESDEEENGVPETDVPESGELDEEADIKEYVAVNDGEGGSAYSAPEVFSTYWPEYANSAGTVFHGSAFGAIGNNALGTDHMVKFSASQEHDLISLVSNEPGGGIAEGQDGLFMYYHRLPKDAVFKITAEAKIVRLPDGGSNLTQHAFGLMARDDMYVNTGKTGLCSDYVVAGSRAGEKTAPGFMRSQGTVYENMTDDFSLSAGEKLHVLSLERISDNKYRCSVDGYSVDYEVDLTAVDSNYIYVGPMVSRTAYVDYYALSLQLYENGEWIDAARDYDQNAGVNDIDSGYTPPKTVSKVWDDFRNRDDVAFHGSVIGSVGATSNPQRGHYAIIDEDTKTSQIVSETISGKITGVTDGIFMYYHRLPVDEDFKLIAKATLNSIGYIKDGAETTDGTSAFGLMARDDMYIDKYFKTLNSNFVVAGSRDANKQRAGFYRKDMQIRENPDDFSIEEGKTYDLSIEKNGNTYITEVDGHRFEAVVDLSVVDQKYLYAGFFVARSADATFSDVQLWVKNESGEYVHPQNDYEIIPYTLPDTKGNRLASGTFKGDDNETDFTWMLDDNDTMWIDGSGSYSSLNIGNQEELKEIQDRTLGLVIGEGITNAAGFENFSSLTRIKFPSTIRKISSHAFNCCFALKEISIPDDVTEIGSYAFGDCIAVKKLELPDTISRIDGAAFIGSGSCLRSLRIPDNLEGVDYTTFSYFYGLTEYTTNDSCKYYKAVDGVLYDKSMSQLVLYPMRKKDPQLVVPEGVYQILPRAAADNQYLKSITIPSTCHRIGEGVFEKCQNVTELIFPENSSLDTIEAYAFRGIGIKELILPEGLKIIEEAAFHGVKLNRVYFPASLKKIYKWNFSTEDIPLRYTSIKGSGIPLNVTYGGRPQDWTKIEVEEPNENLQKACNGANGTSWQWGDGILKSGEINGCSYSFDLDGMLTISGNGALDLSGVNEEEIPWKEYFNDYGYPLNYVRIGEGITSIAAGSFTADGYAGIMGFEIPASVKRIEGGAFRNDNVYTVHMKGAPPVIIQNGDFNSVFYGNGTVYYEKAKESEWLKCDRTKLDQETGDYIWNSCDGEGNTYPCKGMILRSISDIRINPSIPEDEIVVHGSGAPRVDLDAIVSEIIDRDGYSEDDRKSIRSNLYYMSWAEHVYGLSLNSKLSDRELRDLNDYYIINKETGNALTGTDISYCFYGYLTVEHDAPAGHYALVVAPRYGICGSEPFELDFDVIRSDSVLRTIWFTDSDNAAYSGGYSVRIYSRQEQDVELKISGEDQFYNDMDIDLSKAEITNSSTDEVISTIVTDPKNGTITIKRSTPDGNYNIRVGDTTAFISVQHVVETYKMYDLVIEGGDDILTFTSGPVTADEPYKLYIRERKGEEQEEAKNVTWSVTDWLGNDLSDYCSFDENNVLTVSPDIREKQEIRGTMLIRVTASSGRYKRFKNVQLVFAGKPTHTATFMLEGEKLAEVTFEEGAEEITEPAIPDRVNYVGYWEDYDLASATEDIVIKGRYELIDPETNISEVETTAQASYDTGVVTIDLEAVASSKTVLVTSQKTRPVDVVLVMDQSTSMQDRLGSDRSKVVALRECAGTFAEKLFENARDTGADHRLALVGFAYSAYNKGGYKNTGLLVTEKGGFKKYSDLKSVDYTTALLPVNSNGVMNPRLTEGIGSIKADGATSVDVGLQIAKNIFTGSGETKDRDRVIILITDGTPTWWGEDTSLVKSTAAQAMSMAKTLKEGENVKIYSIGVAQGADSQAAFTTAPGGVTTDRWGRFVSYDFNRFLHGISSNYENAQSVDSMGEGANKGYYIGVEETEKLNSIFTGILYSSVYELKSFNETDICYTIPSGFTLTIEQEMKLRYRLKKEYGIDDSAIVVERNEDGTTDIRILHIRVKRDGSGYKAHVEIQVTADAGTIGSYSLGTEDKCFASCDGEMLSSFRPPVIKIENRGTVLTYTVKGQTYSVIENDIPSGTAGEYIPVPESDIARWVIDDSFVLEGSSAEFEADEITGGGYSVQWYVNGEEILQTYRFADEIKPPAVDEGEELSFIGWTPEVPKTMPAYNLAFTAQLHKHVYVAAERIGDCESGVHQKYKCSCGQEKDELVVPPHSQHSYGAVVSDTGDESASHDKLLCKYCGKAKTDEVQYEIAYSPNLWNIILDMFFYDGDNTYGGEIEDDIGMQFYVGNDDVNYSVTRIDEDGSTVSYPVNIADGYVDFHPDHFSMYVLTALHETGTPMEEMDYENAKEALLSGNKRDLASSLPKPSDYCRVTVSADNAVVTGVENGYVSANSVISFTVSAKGGYSIKGVYANDRELSEVSEGKFETIASGNRLNIRVVTNDDSVSGNEPPQGEENGGKGDTPGKEEGSGEEKGDSPGKEEVSGEDKGDTPGKEDGNGGEKGDIPEKERDPGDSKTDTSADEKDRTVGEMVKQPLKVSVADDAGAPIDMDVYVSGYVTYNGRKHISILDKVSKSIIGDISVSINSTVLDYAYPVFKFKNNKLASTSASGKKPYFILSFKAKKTATKEQKKTVKALNKELKTQYIYFEIRPADISAAKEVKLSTDKKATKVTGMEATFADGTVLKLKKKDFTYVMGDGNVTITGQGNYTGTRTEPLTH